MSVKTLVILLVVLALVGGIAMLATRKPAQEQSVEAGDRLLQDLEVNSITFVEISQGVETTRLERIDGTWCVANRFNYPADFERLRQMMQDLHAMEPGQVIRDGTSLLEEFGLSLDDGEAPLQLTLTGAGKSTLLTFGKMREGQAAAQPWGMPQGRYARVNDGAVQLLKDSLYGVNAAADMWMNKLLLEAPPEAVQQVEVTGPAGAYTVERNDDGALVVAGLAEDEEIDRPSADRLFGALRSLRVTTVMDPEEAEEKVSFTNATSYKATAGDLTYTIQIGPETPGLSGRPMTVEVQAREGAAPDAVSEADALQARLAGWTFLLPPYMSESLLLARDRVVKKIQPPPPAAEEPSDEAAPSMPPVEPVNEPPHALPRGS